MLVWKRVFSVLRNRQRHRGGDLQALQRMAIIESASELPTNQRAAPPSPPLSSSVDVMRSLDSILESTSASLLSQNPLSEFDPMSEATVPRFSSLTPKAISLSDFISECRRLRRNVGESRDRHTRLKVRGSLRSFWVENVDNALASCAVQGHDFSFVAGLGLTDDALRISLLSLQFALQSLLRGKSSCSCMDMMLSLHYMARELQHMEETCRKGKAPEGAEMKHLAAFRRALANLAFERIHFFLLERGASGRPLGTAEDALHALEFLTIVKLSDADHSTCVLFTTPVKPHSDKDAYIVTCLFRHIASNQRDLKFTSVVHAFKLLRIFLPILCPPQPQGQAGPSMDDGVAAEASAIGSEREAEHREWRLQCEATDRAVWGLCGAMQRKDMRFVNPFHFVQIMSTIGRLPSYLLSQAPRAKPQQIKKLESFAETLTDGNDLTRKVDRMSKTQKPEELWEYIVSKTCIFIPSLSSSQRRWVCRGLRLALQRREHYLKVSMPHPPRDKSQEISAVEALLMPMVHELSNYPEDYQSAMFDQRPQNT